jgi:hypothetical protein
VAFLAINSKGEVGSYSLQPGFSFAIKSTSVEELRKSKSWF